jgi:hypothetical protein
LKKGLHVASRLSAESQSGPIVPQEWYFVPTHPTVPGERSATPEVIVGLDSHGGYGAYTRLSGASLLPRSVKIL